MKAEIIKAKELKEKNFGDTKVTNIISKKGLFSIAKVRKTGNKIKLGYDKESDVAYYVLDGKGVAIINGKKHKLKKGDLVFYPKGTKYKHLKGLTLLAIAKPPFKRNKRVYEK
jgi:mannose-6-phosphate isomerase-like protein (cupin superfamily)